jgi:hypothetical protein
MIPYRLIAYGGAALLVAFLVWRVLDTQYERGLAAGRAECAEQFRLVEEETQRKIDEAEERGRLDGIAEAEASRETDEEIEVETRTVVRRVEVPVLTPVEACPLNESALQEVTDALNERREAINGRLR